MSDKLNGCFLGIVIQNNDPEKRGRVKVYVPHIAATVYNNWNKDFAKLTDKSFSFPDRNTNPDLANIMQYLKEALPWAELALPVFGGSASGKFNAYTEIGSTSDSNYWENDKPVNGFRPTQNYTGENRLTDAFANINPNASQYSPSDYSNLARGQFSIPNVGSHVWVFFENGDVGFPVVFASSFGQEDWKRIYSLNKDQQDDLSKETFTDYPASYENLAAEETNNFDHNVKTFRSKHVLNSNKHTIELVDTDNAEILKMTHYSGSFLEFSNNVTTRLATNNDQLLVIGDQYTTVQKNQYLYVAHYVDHTIKGDRITKLGDFELRRNIVGNILKILKEIHQYKQLFDITRADAIPDITSPLQVKQGSPASCPVCGGSGIKFGSDCATCNGTGQSPSSQWGTYPLDAQKQNIGNIISAKSASIHELEALFGNGGDETLLITGNRTLAIGTVFNDMVSTRIDLYGKIRSAGVEVGQQGTYVRMEAVPLIEYVDVDSLPGGDSHTTVGNKYTLHVGSKGVHIQTTGPMDLNATIMNMNAQGMYLSSKYEMLIDGGERTEIRGKNIILKPHVGGKKEVFADGNLGVSGNVKVVGGLHTEGELYFVHGTAPKQTYMTEIGYGPIPHMHMFYGPAITLMDDPNTVRQSAQQLNDPLPAPNMKQSGFWVPT